jgi:hypothetical protein
MLSAAALWQFWLAVSLIAITEAVNGVARAYVADLVLPGAIGRSMALFSTISLFAGIVGLSGGRYVMQHVGIGAALILAVWLLLLALAIVLFLRRPPGIPPPLPG